MTTTFYLEKMKRFYFIAQNIRAIFIKRELVQISENQ